MSGPLRGLASSRALGWGGAALGVGLLVATASFGVLLLGTSAWLIAKAALRPSIAALHVAIAGVRFFGLARAISRYLERLVTHDVTLRASGQLRAALAARLAPLAPGRLAAGSGDAMARVVTDVEELEAAYPRLFAPAVAALLVTAGIAAFLAIRGTGLALAWTSAVLVAGVLAPTLVTRGTRAGETRRVATRGVLHARLADGIRGLPDLLAFGRARAHVDEVAGLAASLAVEERRSSRVAAAGGALAGIAADLGVVALIALAIPAIRSGALDGLQLAVVALVALAGFEVVAPLATAFRARGGIEAAAKRIHELLDAAPAVQDPERPLPVGPGNSVEVRRLHFSYGGEAPVLDELDLVLERGRVVALVGPSGAGKSTLVQLLLRVWDVEPGHLLFDGVDVRQLAAADVRSRIASASVRDHVFAGTLRENLRLAAPEASDERLWDAVERAELAPFARGLAEGLDTWVGEHGVALSGGERQRLVLARALLREAPVRLFDEPTAHLDTATAARVMRRLFAEKDSCATLVVSHRLAGLEAADEIVVLVRGRVEERGTWEQLMAKGGAFVRAVAEERGEGALAASAQL
ncbi:MAG: thiol reductant ABC exporter subunit CydC [Vicinamibacteria bacterium]|nr:thiol reductant ABC exporter subunit CydC [Vicinamibacteria bacterium]